MNRRGAEIILDELIERGTDHLFGVCGHGILGLLDAAYDRRSDIRTVTTHDEQAAGFMADAYFRVSHRAAATYSSCGPGSLNIAMPIAAAFQDSSAIFAITGNVPTSQFNRGPFQETGRFFQGDFNSVMRPYVKRSYQAPRADMLPLIVRQAYDLMVTGRPGPVHVDVPLDVFVEECALDDSRISRRASTGAHMPAPDPAAVDRAVDMLLSAERPVIYVGNGLLLGDAHAALRALALRCGIPVLSTPLGKGGIDEANELSLGPTGRNGTLAANSAARESDLVVAIGTRFDDRSTSGWIPGVTFNFPPTKLIHVDIDPTELGRNYRPDISIVSDGRLFLDAINEALSDKQAASIQKRCTAWRARTASWKSEWEIALAERRRIDVMGSLNPYALVHQIDRLLPRDVILLADVGVHHNWLLQQTCITDRMTFLQSWGFAAMGFGVAGAIGAQMAAPGRPVVAVAGDGGFLMTANAVATAVEYSLPIVWVVWNNTGYGSIKAQQKGYFGHKGDEREIATRFRVAGDGDLYSVDMAALAKAMGAEATNATTLEEFSDAFEWALANGRPTVVNVNVDSELSPPGTGSWPLPPFGGPRPDFGWDDSADYALRAQGYLR